MAMRCLIVDDDSSFIEAATALLESEGIAVVGGASTGSEALQRSEELHPDILLIDIHLGAESGLGVARRLAEEWYAITRNDWRPLVILISTEAGEDFEDLIADSSADGFLSKAFLSAGAIRELIRAGSAGLVG